MCASLGLLATLSSSDCFITLFSIGPDNRLTPAGTLGRAGVGPLQFHFSHRDKLTFTAASAGSAAGAGAGALTGCEPSATTACAARSGPRPPTPTLLVTEFKNDRVQEVDVVAGTHVGFLYAPGLIDGPRGVAASHRHIAVTNQPRGGDPRVHLFDASTRTRLWTVPMATGTPEGVCFSGGGSYVVVADRLGRRLVVMATDCGSVVGAVHTGDVHPEDVRECDGGWLVSTGDLHTLVRVSAEDIGRNSRQPITVVPPGDVMVPRRLAASHLPGRFGHPMGLDVAPGLGVVVADFQNHRVQVRHTPRLLCASEKCLALHALTHTVGACGVAAVCHSLPVLCSPSFACTLQVFSTPDQIAMATMSPFRREWIVAVVRGIARRGILQVASSHAYSQW